MHTFLHDSCPDVGMHFPPPTSYWVTLFVWLEIMPNSHRFSSCVISFRTVFLRG